MTDNKARRPTYDLKKFIADCRSNESNVVIHPKALGTAANDLGLQEKCDVCAFFGDDGAEDLRFINTCEWRTFNDGRGGAKPFVDGYEFFIDKSKPSEECFYLAFARLANNKWYIKSLKRQEERFRVYRSGDKNDLTHSPFKELAGFEAFGGDDNDK